MHKPGKEIGGSLHKIFRIFYQVSFQVSCLLSFYGSSLITQSVINIYDPPNVSLPASEMDGYLGEG